MPDTVITPAIEKVASAEDLDADAARAVLDEIMSGAASEVQIAALLIGLRTKGETASEVAGFARAMRSHASEVTTATSDLIDIVGTGGGGSTFNVSTTAAFVIAGAGCTVAKHGNRSATTKSGSADVLEALGVNIELEPEHVSRLIDDIGFGFMFAPKHHAATRYVVPVRKQLAVRTVFNILGPLTNPASAPRQLIGVGYPKSLELMAEAVGQLGTTHTVLVHSEDGLDEVSIAAPTKVYEVTPQGIKYGSVTPEEIGITTGNLAEIEGGTPEQNAAVSAAVLRGELPAGHPATEIVVANAGAGIYVAGKAQTIREGVELARQSISSKAASDKLDAYRAASHAILQATQ